MLVSRLLAFIAPKSKAAMAFFGCLLAFLDVWFLVTGNIVHIQMQDSSLTRLCFGALAWHSCSGAHMEVCIAAFSANTKHAFETAKPVSRNGNRPNKSMITMMKTTMLIIAGVLMCSCTRAQPGKTQQQQLIESAVASYAQHCGGKTTTAACVELHNSLKDSLNSFFADHVQQDPNHHAAEQSWLVEMRQRLEAVR
jgi:hypothetical protein